MSKALALKYRPKRFEDLTEQSEVVTILTNQIETNTIKHGYLFCGGAGTGKTTSARIFANMINEGKGTPIELDAASNNSVEDIRRLCDDAQTQSIDSLYKVFVIDECHSLSNQAWQAFLKTLEEPPAKSIFILCTTNPERIPQTILSRVQRYNFQRISFEGIVNRLENIILWENEEISDKSIDIHYQIESIEYIAKIADGGLRDAITLMDKCLSYSNNLTMDNVIKALGIANYEVMFNLTSYIISNNISYICNLINEVHSSGMDLKLFIKQYFEFILDLNVYSATNDMNTTKIPLVWEEYIHNNWKEKEWDTIYKLLSFITDLNYAIKWEQNPKAVIIAKFILFDKEV